LSDQANADAAALALYRASGGRIKPDALAVMVAIAGRESGWDPGAVQEPGPVGAPLIGVGLWQITPGTENDLTPDGCAASAWALMNRDPSSPFEPWNLQPDGRTLIYAWAQTPAGPVRTYPPSSYEYQVGATAAANVHQEVAMPLFITNKSTVYWFIPGGTESYWRPMPPAAAALVPAVLIIDDPNGILLGMWKIGA